MSTSNRPSGGRFSSSIRSRTTCRLVNWRLENFKSVIRQEIALSPLTVLVGANSSGKSSLIQSILFMAQNAQNPQTEDSRRDLARGYLQLNGDLVQLGTHKEVLNDSAKETFIGLGGKLEYSTSESPSLYERSPQQEHTQESRNLEIEAKVLDWKVKFKEPVGVNPLSGVIESDEARASLTSNNENIGSIESYTISAEKATRNSDNYQSSPSSSAYNFAKNATVTSYDDSLDQNSPTPLSGEQRLEAVHYVVGIPATGLISTSRAEVFIRKQELMFTDPSMQRSVFEKLKDLLADHFGYREVNRVAEQALQILDFNPRRLPLRRSFVCSSGHNFMSIRLVSRCPYCDEIVDSQNQANRELLSEEDARRMYISDSLDLLQSGGARAHRAVLLGSPLIDPLNINLIIPPKDPDTSFAIQFLDALFGIKGPFPYQEIGSLLKKSNIALDEKLFVASFELIFKAIQNFWKDTKKELLDKTKDQTSSTILQSPREIISPGSPFFRRDVSADELPVGEGILQFKDLLQKVVYLGPLRAAPVDLFSRFQGARSDQMPLGRDGGYLAQKVYENIECEREDLPLPPCSTHRNNRKVYFKDALEDWMKCLGVGSKIESTLQGHYGYLLTVDGKSLRVMGTGVSQVLPVLALCLIAPSNGIVLLEEPELHLHPRIQQKLGNFFLAVSESGKQVIVETHSEYLITRLRLIAAQRPEQAKMFSFVFTSKEIHQGNERTIFRSINADSTGELPPWPEGFFDQVTGDIKELIVSLASKQIDQSE